MNYEAQWYAKEDFENENNKDLLCAMGLVQWANCMHGNTPPKDFGEGLVIAGQKLGISPTGDEFSKYADENILNKE